MERYFIVGENSKFHKDCTTFINNTNKQRKFVKEFFEDKGIDGLKYIMGADGFVNQPYTTSYKDDIYLAVEPTEINLEKFKSMLRKQDQYGLCKFRAKSSILKEFAQRCVDEKVIINLYAPRVSDYFESLQYGLFGCTHQIFEYEGNYYLKVENDHLGTDDTPDGFKEIKASEFYTIKEKNDGMAG